MSKQYTFQDLQSHRTAESCWVVLYGHVYDVTKFLDDHPGGSQVILRLAGTDATEQYDPVHPPGTLEDNRESVSKLGPFDMSTLPPTHSTATAAPPTTPRENTNTRQTHDDAPRSIEECLNLDDIEALATRKLSHKAWSYYFSASDDLVSKSLNNAVYSRILLRPRIFIDITRCDLSTRILSHPVQAPFFVSPAAMARLGHPDGEHGIARACGKWGVAQMISNNASQTPEQIVAGASPDQIFGWQIYVQNDRRKSEEMLARIQKLPAVKFIVLTLDAPVPGKREHDERAEMIGARLPVSSSLVSGSTSNSAPPSNSPSSSSSASQGSTEEEPLADAKGTPISGAGGVGRALFAGTAGDLTWTKTLPWLRAHTNLPIILKGVQTHEDAYIASLHAPHISGIILSNHGGRALDTASPPIHTLLEIHRFCPGVLQRLEVYIDGGIRRGTDVVKALALGATAVGLGRAPLYGNGAAGTKGVERVFEILTAEIATCMRLLGVQEIAQLKPHHVNARMVERNVYDGPAAPDREAWATKSKL